MLRDGEASLGNLQRKTLTSGRDSVIVQANPARRRSTLAKTDAQSVAARRCFLCPENMPAEERGVAFEDLVVMPNPFPVLPMHCTIAAREHRPQLIAGRIDCALRLAAAIGPDLAAFYNGPRCGASAPDHFHFQAASASEIPILAQLPMTPAGKTLLPHSTFGRHMLIARDTDVSAVRAAIESSDRIAAQYRAHNRRTDAESDCPSLASQVTRRYFFRGAPTDRLAILPLALTNSSSAQPSSKCAAFSWRPKSSTSIELMPRLARKIYQEVSIARRGFRAAGD